MAISTEKTYRLKQPVIQGTIDKKGGTFVEGVPKYLLNYTNAAGEAHQGYFSEEQLEEVKGAEVKNEQAKPA